jgi:hypothetical protein
VRSLENTVQDGVSCFTFRISPGATIDLMTVPITKEKIIETIRTLPDDATLDDVMERLYFLSKLERGLRESEAGQTMSHEEVKKRLGL